MMTLFPEFESIFHGETVGKVLEKIDFTDIDAIHVAMIKKLIKKKKFNKFLLLGNLPISIDGVHKLSRDGELQSIEWVERKIKSADGKITQQYGCYIRSEYYATKWTNYSSAQSIYTL